MPTTDDVRHMTADDREQVGARLNGRLHALHYLAEIDLFEFPDADRLDQAVLRGNPPPRVLLEDCDHWDLKGQAQMQQFCVAGNEGRTALQ